MMKNLIHQIFTYLLVFLSVNSAYGRPYSSKHTHYHQDGTYTTCTYAYNDRINESSSRCYTDKTPTVEEKRRSKEIIGERTESLLKNDLEKIDEFLKVKDIDNACKQAITARITINNDVFSSYDKRELYRQKLSTLTNAPCKKWKKDCFDNFLKGGKYQRCE